MSRTRGVIAPPSSSPTRKVATLPCMTRPGAITSAPKFTKLDSTRARPTASMSVSAVRPFCTVST